MQEGNFLPVNPGASLRNSNKSHSNKRKAPEEAPVLRWKQDQIDQGHPVWVNSVQGLGAGVPALPAAPPLPSRLF
jgi:hypothetical protein